MTEAELRLRKSRDALKQADQQLQATLAASKPRKIVPKSATQSLQQRAALFKVKREVMKRTKANKPMKAVLRGNSKTGFQRR